MDVPEAKSIPKKGAYTLAWPKKGAKTKAAVSVA